MERILTDQQIELINSLIEDRVEYEEEHRDAGEGYAHLLGESWHSDYDNRLREALAEHGVELGPVDFDQLAEDVIFWAEMVPSHIYDNSPKAGQILLDSYAIGEMEIEISAEELGCDRISAVNIEQMNRECDAYFRHSCSDRCYAYISSDRSWDAQISIEQIRLLIEQLAERIAA